MDQNVGYFCISVGMGRVYGEMWIGESNVVDREWSGGTIGIP